MIINDLTLTSIGAVIDKFKNTKGTHDDITSEGAIELDLAGIQLLIIYQKDASIKVSVELTESSLELLMKTGFNKYISDNKFILE